MTEPELFFRMQSLDQIERTSYAEKGQICLAVSKSLIHRARLNTSTGLPCSLTEWIRLAAPWGYATCFAAMRDVEALQDISSKDLSEIPQSNFQVLKQLSTAIRAEPSVIQAAKTKRTSEFVAQVKKDHPNQHIESRRTLRFTVDESEAVEIEEALTLAMERAGAMNQTEALLAVCINYRADMLLEDLAKETTE